MSEIITDQMLNAHLQATGDWLNPSKPETCGMTQATADECNAGLRAALRKGYAAALSISTREQAASRSSIVEECAVVADNAALWDEEYAAKYPDETEKMRNRSHRARTIAGEIRRLVTP